MFPYLSSTDVGLFFPWAGFHDGLSFVSCRSLLEERIPMIPPEGGDVETRNPSRTRKIGLSPGWSRTSFDPMAKRLLGS